MPAIVSQSSPGRRFSRSVVVGSRFEEETVKPVHWSDELFSGYWPCRFRRLTGMATPTEGYPGDLVKGGDDGMNAVSAESRRWPGDIGHATQDCYWLWDSASGAISSSLHRLPGPGSKMVQIPGQERSLGDDRPRNRPAGQGKPALHPAPPPAPPAVGGAWCSLFSSPPQDL